MRKEFLKLAAITIPAGLAVAAVFIVAFSAYMNSVGVEPPNWVLWYSVPAGIIT